MFIDVQRTFKIFLYEITWIMYHYVKPLSNDNKNEPKKEPPEFKRDVKNSKNSNAFKFEASKNKTFSFENSGLY